MLKNLKSRLKLFKNQSGNNNTNSHHKDCKCECHLENQNSCGNEKIIVNSKLRNFKT